MKIIIKNINGIILGKWKLDAENLMNAVKIRETLPTGKTIEEYPTINFSNDEHDTIVGCIELLEIEAIDEMQKFIDAKLAHIESTSYRAIHSRVISELFGCKA